MGTKEGVLERLYSHNEFTFADCNFVNLSDVPSWLLNLRKAFSGFVRCRAILNATIMVPAKTSEYLSVGCYSIFVSLINKIICRN